MRSFSSAGSRGDLEGTKLWVVPPTPNGLVPTESWFSVGGAPDGNMYVGAGDHVANSALYRVSPEDDVLRYLGDARSASEAARNWLPGETAEKFHVRPTWYRGRVYVATADYSNQDDRYLQHRGFHWYGYDARSRDSLDLSASEPGGIAAEHISIFSIGLDERRGLLYGLGSPTAHLYQYNIATAGTADLGRSALLEGKYYQPGRFLWVDRGGRVYFTVGAPVPGDAGSHPPAPQYVLYWDPVQGWGAHPDWPVPQMLRTGQWSMDKKHLYILDYPLNLYLYNDENRTFVKLGQGVLDAQHTSPRTRSVRVRSMNVSANERKIYFVNDTASVNSLYEWEFEKESTPRELARIPAIDGRLDARYNAFLGHDSWDSQGRFYFTGFGGEGGPSTPNVYLVRVDPVRAKAALGMLPGVPVVRLQNAGAGLALARHGDRSTPIDVLLRGIPKGDHAGYRTVTMPAGVAVVPVPASDRDEDDSLSVVPDGDTYVVGVGETNSD